MTPADPTPSAAVAPTGGETVTRYDLCCGEESAWMEPGPTGAYVLFEDVRAALSPPVRAEPTRCAVIVDAGGSHDVPTICDRPLECPMHGRSAPVRAERGEAEQDAMRLDIPGGLETRIVEYATAIPDGRADDVMIHLTTPDKTYLGTLTLGWFREHTSVGEAERQVLYGETMRAKLAALTPTPPATPTERRDHATAARESHGAPETVGTPASAPASTPPEQNEYVDPLCLQCDHCGRTKSLDSHVAFIGEACWECEIGYWRVRSNPAATPTEPTDA